MDETADRLASGRGWMERDTEALVVRYLMEITRRRFPKATAPVAERVIDEATGRDRLDD